jgi:DNA-binding response OmpR family regulator
MNISILLVDNDPTFLSLCQEYLELNHYRVVTANNYTAALNAVETNHVHLAILDLRLSDQDDAKDRGGLQLARQLPPALPKLILTQFPTYKDVVEALKPQGGHLPLAIDYVNKQDGLEILLIKLQEAQAHHLPINWALALNWQPRQLIQRMLSDLIPAQLEARTAELEDLFRRLFSDSQQLTIDTIISQTSKHLSVKAFTFDKMNIPGQFIITCGQLEAIQAIWQQQMANGPYLNSTKMVAMYYFGGIAYLAGHDTIIPPPLPQPPHTTSTSLWIDSANKSVWVAGNQIDLTVQEYQILNYLYQNAGQLCERQDIVEQGLGEVFDPYDPEQSRLNSAMSRLRRKIESDPQNPRHLITVRNRGYRLEL